MTNNYEKKKLLEDLQYAIDDYNAEDAKITRLNLPLVEVDSANKRFKVAGDQRSQLANNVKFRIEGSPERPLRHVNNEVIKSVSATTNVITADNKFGQHLAVGDEFTISGAGNSDSFVTFDSRVTGINRTTVSENITRITKGNNVAALTIAGNHVSNIRVGSNVYVTIAGETKAYTVRTRIYANPNTIVTVDATDIETAASPPSGTTLFWHQSVFTISNTAAAAIETALNEPDTVEIYIAPEVPFAYAYEGYYEVADINRSGNTLTFTIQPDIEFPAFSATDHIRIKWNEERDNPNKPLNYNGTYVATAVTERGGANGDTLISVANIRVGSGSGANMLSQSRGETGVINFLEKRDPNFNYTNDGEYTVNGTPSRSDSNRNTQITVDETIPNNIVGGNLVYVEDNATKRAANATKLNAVRTISEAIWNMDRVG